jgi:hypothetical protein
MYKTLNDAAQIDPIFEAGNTKIWYANDDHHIARGLRCGDRPANLIANLKETHVLIGTIKGSANLDDIFEMMQGENYSPEGQARNLIQQSGTYHTSMSVGDIIENENGIFYLVSGIGFTVLSN